MKVLHFSSALDLVSSLIQARPSMRALSALRTLSTSCCARALAAGGKYFSRYSCPSARPIPPSTAYSTRFRRVRERERLREGKRLPRRVALRGRHPTKQQHS